MTETMWFWTPTVLLALALVMLYIGFSIPEPETEHQNGFIQLCLLTGSMLGGLSIVSLLGVSYVQWTLWPAATWFATVGLVGGLTRITAPRTPEWD